MPVIRTPEQVVLADIQAIWSADSNKFGQGTSDILVREIVRDTDPKDHLRLTEPYITLSMAVEERHPMSSMRHALVLGTLTIVVNRDRGDADLDELVQGTRTALHGVSIASGGDTDWLPERLIFMGPGRVSSRTQERLSYSMPFSVFVVRVGNNEGPQLHGDVATITYTPGSGGSVIITGTVEEFSNAVSHQMVSFTPATEPNTPIFYPGPGVGSVQLRMKVTSATGSSYGNPRIPDGVAATLTLYKAGSSGQRTSQSVFIESSSHSGGLHRGQTVTYRLRRTGATTETLS